MNEPEIETRDFTFKDREGRLWDLTLTMAGARRIDNSDFSALTDKEFSILRPEPSFFGEVLMDTPILFAMIWAIVKPQAEKVMGIDPDDPKKTEEAEAAFLDGIDGNTVDEARQAFWRALVNFFPRHKTALSALARQAEKAEGMIQKEVAGMEKEMERAFKSHLKEETAKLRKEFGEKLGEKSTESSESSGGPQVNSGD